MLGDHSTKREQITGILGLILMGIFMLLLLILGLLPFHAMETESYALFIVWSVLGLAYFRQLIRRDKSRNYGQQRVVVWVILLVLMLFASMMWVSRATENAANTAVERIAYSRMNALTSDMMCAFIVVPETGRYRQYSAASFYSGFGLPLEGEDFFTVMRDLSGQFVCPEDVGRFCSLFTREGVLSAIERSGIFSLSYRLKLGDKLNYVQIKAAMVEEKEGARLIVGINDVDSSVRQEEEYARRLAHARNMASIDALTGIKNKHAFLEAEEKINRHIAEKTQPEFAVIVLDVNDLKKINDTEGHQAGDQYLRDACKFICNVFKHSPVFWVGGDEFAVISQGSDYACIEQLVRKVNDHNSEAARSGGIVIACGMAKYRNDDCVAAVYERADQNMYENKSVLKAGKK